MADSKFGGAPPPVRGSVRWPQVVTVTHHWPLSFILLGGPICGYWTHWVPGFRGKTGATRWCNGSPACEWCRAGLGQRWVAYTAALGRESLSACVPMFTEEGGRGLMRLASAPEGELRGLVVRVERLGTNTKSPQAVTCAGRYYTRLPEPFDHEVTLQRLWGLADLPRNLLAADAGKDGAAC